MSGVIHRMIDEIIQARSNGDPTVASTTRTKLVLKGVNPRAYDASSPDDPEVIAKLHAIAADFGVSVH
jgi:hypothetical protein